MNRRGFLKGITGGAASTVIPGSAAFIAAQATAIRLAVLSRAVPLASRAWYKIVDEAINLSASFPKTEGALFTLFMKFQSK